MDVSLYPNCDFIWQGFYNAFPKADSILRRFAFHLEPHLQLLLHLLPIRPKEQLSRRRRHPPRPHHSHLGHARDFPNRSLDYLHKHPISPLGQFRHGFAAGDYLFE